MSITKESELTGMKEISEVVGTTLRLMREHAQVGMSTKTLNEYVAGVLYFGSILFFSRKEGAEA